MTSVFDRVKTLWEKEKMLVSQGFLLKDMKSRDCLVEG